MINSKQIATVMKPVFCLLLTTPHSKLRSCDPAIFRKLSQIRQLIAKIAKLGGYCKICAKYTVLYDSFRNCISVISALQQFNFNGKS